MKKILIIAIVLLLCSLAQGQYWENPNQKPSLFGMRINRAHPLGKNIVGYWPMFENKASKVFDLSGNERDITLSGVTWQAGQFGPCLYFDGSAGSGSTGNFDLTGTNQLTISFWIYIYTLGDTDILVEMSDNYNSYTDSFIIHLNTDSGITGAVKGNVGYSSWDTNILSTNTWYYVVVTLDMTLASSEAKIYINTLLNGAVNNDSNNTANFGNRPLYIGARNNSSLYANVKIDDLNIHKRILSASEIALLYREPFCFMEPAWDWVLYGGIAAPSIGGQFIFINQ